MNGDEKKGLHINTSAIKNTLINFLVPIISLIVTIGILTLVIYPSINSIPELKQELSNAENLRTTLENKVTILNRLKDFSSVVEENSELINKVLNSEEKVPQLLNQIDTISKDGGLSVERLNYSIGAKVEEADSTFSSVTVSLGATGNYDQMLTFLDLIENAARFVSVTRINFSANGADNKEFLDMNYSLVSPYLFVQSTADTDDPVDLDITSTEFIDLINKIKEFKYYEFTDEELSVTPEEVTEEEIIEDSTSGAGTTEPGTGI